MDIADEGRRAARRLQSKYRTKHFQHLYSSLWIKSAESPYSMTLVACTDLVEYNLPIFSLAHLLFEFEYNYSYTQIMKTAISIPDDVFYAAEELSKSLGMSRSELYTKAVAAFIASQRGEGVREKLDAIYEVEDSGLDPVLSQWQWLSLSREDW